MNRVLKRPMFRMGGSTGTGITSGLGNTQELRPGFKNGTPFNVAEDAQRRIDLINQFAPRMTSAFSPGSLSGFLTSTGLNLLSAIPRGNIFATAAGAAKEPFDAFTTAKAKESAEDRALSMSALQSSISRGDVLSDLDRKEKFEERQLDKTIKAEADLQRFIYDKKADIEEIKGKYDVLAEKAGGTDKLNVEVTNDLIRSASQSIFDTRQTLDSGVKLVDGKKVPLTETDVASMNEIIKQNQLFLEKQLGLPAEYVAVLQSPERYDAAKRSAVNDANNKRKQDWLAANPQRTGESNRDYQKRFANEVKEIDIYSQEADLIAQEYIRKQYYTYAKGGRVGYSIGGGADMSQQPATMEQGSSVQDLDDEIIMLLANSKQALLDFANIKTPQDIASFNQQYDVNLTLPQGA